MKRIFSFESPFTLLLICISLTISIIQEFYIPDFAKFFATNNNWNANIVLHIFGHGNWEHLTGNIIYIAMLGPSLEKKLSKKVLIPMTLIGAAVVGIVSVLTNSPCYGLSSIVYMWVILNTFQNDESDGIPITGIILLLLFVMPEVFLILKKDGIAHQNHIIGAVYGLIMGIFYKFFKKFKD